MGLYVKITGTGTPALVAVLCDSPDPLPVFGLTVNNERMLSVTQLYQAAFPLILDKQNRLKRISFQVTRLHETEAEALAFTLDHDDEVPATGTLEITATDETGQAFSRFFTAAGVPGVQMVGRKGASTVWRYELLAGQTLKKL